MTAKRSPRAQPLTNEVLGDITDAFEKRCGSGPYAPLAWAVRLVQYKTEDFTPGDWENVRSELHSFVGFTERARPPVFLPTPPSTTQAEEAIRRMRTMIQAAIRRQPVPLVPFTGPECLRWSGERWYPYREYGVRGWPDRVAISLAKHINDYGHLLRDCPAPALRTKHGERCGVWFVGNRPTQEYCSARCQNRASTRASRAGTSTPAAERRKALKEG